MNSAIPTESVCITPLWAMKYCPKNLKMDVRGRKQHSILYIEEGTYRFRFGAQSFLAETGDLIYIPKGSVHSFEITSRKHVCYQVEFEIQNSEFCFSSCPIKLEGSSDAARIMIDMVNRFDSGILSDYLSARGSLYWLCSMLAGQVQENVMKNSRIRPAVAYLEKHCHEKIDVDVLAELCCMSPSQLRRYFAKEYQSTPTAYKNRLRIEKAKRILCHEDVSIGETAQKLGFENIYAFSNAFKKHAGISPSQFIKNLKGNE